jgi:hypothetical protein
MHGRLGEVGEISSASDFVQLTLQVIDDVHKGCRVASWRMQEINSILRNFVLL